MLAVEVHMPSYSIGLKVGSFHVQLSSKIVEEDEGELLSRLSRSQHSHLPTPPKMPASMVSLQAFRPPVTAAPLNISSLHAHVHACRSQRLS